MTSLKSFRQALQTELATDLGITFRHGKIDRNPQADRDLGCCWSAGKRQAENANEELLEVHARVFKRLPARRRVDPELPYDPAVLEDLAESIQTALTDKKATQLGVWFFDLVELELDHDAYFVEATIVGRQTNLF